MAAPRRRAVAQPAGLQRLHCGRQLRQASPQPAALRDARAPCGPQAQSGASVARCGEDMPPIAPQQRWVGHGRQRLGLGGAQGIQVADGEAAPAVGAADALDFGRRQVAALAGGGAGVQGEHHQQWPPRPPEHEARAGVVALLVEVVGGRHVAAQLRALRD